MFEAAAFGPFIGDWKSETFVFRPFVRWVTETINIDKVFISSHTNRLFLYDWIDEKNRIPIYEDISRDEISQIGFLHKSVNKTDYNLLIKLYKEVLQEKCDSYIHYFPLNYTKFFQYPFYCRVFTKIDINNVKRIEGDYYLYIPDENEKPSIVEEVYNLLYSKYKKKIVVCGDMKTHLNEKNKVLSKKDYFQNGYKYIMSYINGAKVIICPMGFWTFIANMQEKPVFSWTTNSGNTVYRNKLKEKNIFVIQEKRPKQIVRGFEYFLKSVK